LALHVLTVGELFGIAERIPIRNTRAHAVTVLFFSQPLPWASGLCPVSKDYAGLPSTFKMTAVAQLACFLGWSVLLGGGISC
jgi:hypothetical protein